MDISERTLRAMVREVDEAHRDTLAGLGDEVTAGHAALLDIAGPTSRREFARRLGLAGVTIGTSIVSLGAFVGNAAAQATDDAPLTIDMLMRFAQAVELAAVQGYAAAGASGKVTTPAVLEAAVVFAGHHRDHAEAFGRGSFGTPSAALLQQVGDQIASAPDEAAVLEIAYTLENAAASTYQFALGEIARFNSFEPPVGATTTTEAVLGGQSAKEAQEIFASILPIESSHAVVLGAVLGKHLDQEAIKRMLPPFESTTAALDPKKLDPELFPLTTPTTTA